MCLFEIQILDPVDSSVESTPNIKTNFRAFLILNASIEFSRLNSAR